MADPDASVDEDELGMPRKARDIAAGLALAGLVVWAAADWLLALVLVMSSDPCGPGDPELICTTHGQDLAAYVPIIGGAAAVVVGVIGVALGPRRRAVGLTLGYLIAFGTSLTGMVIAAR